MRSKYNYLNYLKYLLSCTIAVGGAILCYPLKTNAAPILQIKPITWDVIGLDSNKPSNAGPDTFNIGARVCNVGDAKAANVTANFVREGTINSHITITGSSTLTIPSLPAGTSFHNPGNTGPIPANCTDFYFNAKIERVAAAFNTTQKYRIDATAKDENGNSLGTVSTPAGRQLFVEKLVEQNRNDVISFDGPTSVQVGDVVTYTISGKTSTAYEQLVFTTNFPNNIFQVLNVSTGYTQNGVSNNANYADACGWDSNPTSPTYRSCIGPANYPGGKVGNTFTTKYTVKIISTGGTSAAKISNLIYDFSGSSYHYNTDYNDATESRNINVMAANQSDLSLTKTVNNSSPSVGQNITYSIAVNNSGPDNATNVKIKDILPTGLSYVSSSDNVGGFYNPSTGIWDVGTVPKNGSATLQITAKVNTNTPITNTAQVSASDQTDPDSTPNNNNANEDDQASVTINQGSASLSGTLYQDLDAGNDFDPGEPTLPANITLKLLDSSNNVIATTTTDSSGNYSFLNRPNGSYTIQVDTSDSDIPAGYALTTPNNVPVTVSGANISNINFGFQSPKIVGYKSVKLSTDADSSTTPTPGDTLTWTIVYANTGAVDVPNFQVSDTLPSKVTLAGVPTVTTSGTGQATPTANSSYNGTSNTNLLSSAVTLKAGGVITISIPVTLNSGSAGTTQSNQATGSSNLLATGIKTDNIDNTTTGLPSGVSISPSSITQTQNSASIDPTTVTIVAPTANLSISKTDGQTSTTPGSPITYTIIVTNNGPSTVNSVKVTDAIPASIQNPVFTPSTGSYDSSTGNWTGLNLPSGQQVTLTLKGTVSSTATGTITNTASVDPPAGTTDPNTSNNTANDATTVTSLSISGTVYKDLDAGDDFDSGEPTLPNITVKLLDSNNNVVATTNTASNGTYSFTSVVNGSYKVQVDTSDTDIPAGLQLGTSNDIAVSVSGSNISNINFGFDAPDLTISKSHTGDFTVGTSASYTLTIKNIGAAATSGTITVTDSLPAGLSIPNGTVTLTGTNASAWSCSAANNVITCTSNSALAATNGTSTFNITGIQVAATAEPYVINTATVSGGGQTNTSNDSVNDRTTVNPASDLSIIKTDSPDPAIAGANLTYAIAVTNNGSSTATNATMSDPLPSGTTFQSITAPSGWNCTTPAVGSNGTVNCTNSSFAVGTANFTVVVKVDPNTASSTTLNNTATVTSSTADTNTGNNSSSQTTTVQQSADLRLSKVSNPPSPAVGGTFDYIITVTNDGPSTATNVKVKDELPINVGYVLNTPSQGTYDSINTKEWSVGTLNPGASATLTIRAIRNTAANTVNTAEVIAADQPDPDSPHNNNIAGEDDQDSVTVPNQSVDLAVTKTVNNSTPRVGQNVTFTVTVTNPSASTVAATNVGLTDVLPAGLTYQSHTVSTGTYNSGTGVWNVGTLNSGTTATLTITATVTNSGAKTNTAQLSALDQNDPITGNNTASATVTASSISPKISLVKRITAINGTPISGFDGTQTDPNGNGNTSEDTYWPIPFNNYLPGRIDGGSVKPDDEVEYTIYFLNSQESATNVTACDLVPPNTTFIPTGFNTASPHPIESGALPTDTGIALVLYPADATTLPNPPIPTVYLTNVADSDRGRYYAPNDPNTPASCRNISNNATGAAANTNGAIVVNVVRSTDSVPNNTLPYANDSGTPPRSYGFVRFKVRVK